MLRLRRRRNHHLLPLKTSVGAPKQTYNTRCGVTLLRVPVTPVDRTQHQAASQQVTAEAHRESPGGNDLTQGSGMKSDSSTGFARRSASHFLPSKGIPARSSLETADDNFRHPRRRCVYFESQNNFVTYQNIYSVFALPQRDFTTLRTSSREHPVLRHTWYNRRVLYLCVPTTPPHLRRSTFSSTHLGKSLNCRVWGSRVSIPSTLHRFSARGRERKRRRKQRAWAREREEEREGRKEKGGCWPHGRYKSLCGVIVHLPVTIRQRELSFYAYHTSASHFLFTSLTQRGRENTACFHLHLTSVHTPREGGENGQISGDTYHTTFEPIEKNKTKKHARTNLKFPMLVSYTLRTSRSTVFFPPDNVEEEDPAAAAAAGRSTAFAWAILPLDPCSPPPIPPPPQAPAPSSAPPFSSAAEHSSANNGDSPPRAAAPWPHSRAFRPLAGW